MGAAKTAVAPPTSSRQGTAVVVLAAGASSRMGRSKPLIRVAGQRMLNRILDTVRAAGLDHVVVVLGSHAAEIRSQIPLAGVTVVENAGFAQGMSGSLRAGIRAIDPDTNYILTVLADQPFVSSETLRSLVRRSEEGDGSIFIPTYRGVWGNPVLFDARLAPDLDDLEGDVGCRGMFPKHTTMIREVPVDDPGVLVDIDTEAELRTLDSALGAGESLSAVLDRLARPRWALHSSPEEHPVPKRLHRSPNIEALAHELRADSVPFALATVVRILHPSSGRPGYKAIIRADGTHVGWVGGACTEHLLITEGLAALREGTPRLLRVAPDGDLVSVAQDGVVDRPMTCQSGGTVEIFIEPQVPKPNLLIVGDSPVASSLAAMGPLLGYRVTLAAPGANASDLPDVDQLVSELDEIAAHSLPGTYAIVASMGKYDESALGQILRASVAFVGLVASRKRATGVFATLRESGVPADLIAKIRCPVGVDIAASTPEEIALSILAELTQVRRTTPPMTSAPSSPTVAPDRAVDPVCHMEVERSTPLTAVHAGTTYYFCAESCRRQFLGSPTQYLAA
ncbi:MAG: NTP transferase domain-containing protein [Thermoplasmata archaeon]